MVEKWKNEEHERGESSTIRIEAEIRVIFDSWKFVYVLWFLWDARMDYLFYFMDTIDSAASSVDDAKTTNFHTIAKTIGRKCNSMRRNRAISRFTDHNEDEEETASVVWLFWFEKWWNHSKDSSWLAVFSFQWDECLKIIHISKSHTSLWPHTQNHQKSSNDRVLNELRLSFCVSSLFCRFRVSTTSGECED